MTIAKDMMVNDGIRARELRVIGSNSEQLGVITKSEALKLAEEANLDLVLVAPKAKPPVARIMDHGNSALSNRKKNAKPVKIKKSSTSKK